MAFNWVIDSLSQLNGSIERQQERRSKDDNPVQSLMVTTVVVINLSIAAFCLYAARKVWQMSRTLARVADTLIMAERRTYAVLAGAPQGILRGQVGTQQLRQKYRQLELQLQKVQQVLALTGMSQFVWQWYTRRKLAHSGQSYSERSPHVKPSRSTRSRSTSR